MTKGRGILPPRQFWTDEEDRIFAAWYPIVRTENLAICLGRTLRACYARAKTQGLEKNEAFRASPASGRTNGRQGIGTRFVKGQAPANKGKRCEEGRGGRHPNARRTQFVKGVRRGVAVKLYQPIGFVRVTKDGYLSQKVNDGMPLQRRWRLVHLIRWEAEHGPFNTRTHALKCLDGNRKNVDPSNWTPVPRAIMPRLNGGRWGKKLAYDDAPAELKPTVLAVAKLEHAARSKTA